MEGLSRGRLLLGGLYRVAVTLLVYERVVGEFTLLVGY